MERTFTIGIHHLDIMALAELVEKITHGRNLKALIGAMPAIKRNIIVLRKGIKIKNSKRVWLNNWVIIGLHGIGDQVFTL